MIVALCDTISAKKHSDRRGNPLRLLFWHCGYRVDVCVQKLLRSLTFVRDDRGGWISERTGDGYFP